MFSLGNIWWIGLVAGAVMSIVALLLTQAKFNKLDMLKYDGAFFTAKPTGFATLALGLLLHAAASIIIAYIYILTLRLLGLPANWYYGILLGVIHWIIAGLIAPIMDGTNIGVRSGLVLPMGAFAYKFGLGSMITFALTHLAYGLTVGLLYSEFVG